MSSCNLKTKHDKKYHCYFELALLVLGGKWKAIILYHLSAKSVLRYGELKKDIPNITEKMLTQQLRELEADQMVRRKVYRQVPPKVEYSLTDFGKTIIPILMQLRDWGITYEQKFNLTRHYRGDMDYEQAEKKS